MTGPKNHEMDSQIPYVQPIPQVVRHRRPVALPAGLHGLMPVSQRTLWACVLYMPACVFIRTIRHQLIVEGSKSIQYQTGYCGVPSLT